MTKPEKKSRKEAAVSFLRLVVARRIREAYAAYVSPRMRHHNVHFAGDAASLEKAMEEAHAKFPDTTLDVKHALEDGDLVAVHSHVCMRAGAQVNAPQPEAAVHRTRSNERAQVNAPQLEAAVHRVAVVHLFRFEGNLIVEMWDIGQPVPESTPNENGMF